jgi:hypothetical protein
MATSGSLHRRNVSKRRAIQNASTRRWLTVISLSVFLHRSDGTFEMASTTNPVMNDESRMP